MRWIGSMMTAARSSALARTIASSASRSLNGAMSVRSCTTAGMPAVSGSYRSNRMSD